MTKELSNVKTFAYIRVSSKDQNEARQVDTMLELGVHERDIYIDKLSGRDTERPQYQALKAVVRPGDTIIFDSITRMSRNMTDIKNEYDSFKQTGVLLKFVNEPMLNTETINQDDTMQRAVSDIILTLLSAFAEKERDDIRKRQAEGIASARKRGQHLGRPRIGYDTLDDQQRALFHDEYKRWKDGQQTAVQTFKNVGLTKSTFYKVVREYEEATEQLQTT